MKRIKVVMISCVLLVFMVMGNLTGVLATSQDEITIDIDLVKPDGDTSTIKCTFVVIEDPNDTGVGKVQVGDGENPAIAIQTSGSITIPDTVTDFDNKTYKVTAIADNAFAGCTELTNTGLENNESIITIGQFAFWECSGLTSTGLEMNRTVEIIEIGAFSDCTSLKRTGLQSNQTVKNIDGAVFNGCTGLISTGLESNTTVETIGDEVFRQCTGLTSTGLENNTTVETIGYEAFASCFGLTRTGLESNTTVKTIGELAFANCTELKGVLIPVNSSIISIGEKAFIGCSKLNLVIIDSNKIPLIGAEAFPSNTIIYYLEGATNSENLEGYNVETFKIHNVKVDESSLANNYTEGDTFTLAGLKFIIQHEKDGKIIDKPERSKRYEDIADKFKFKDIILKEGVNTIKYSYLDKDYSFEITALPSATSPIPDNSVPETGNVNDKTILINLLGISGLGLVTLAFRKKRFVK